MWVRERGCRKKIKNHCCCSVVHALIRTMIMAWKLHESTVRYESITKKQHRIRYTVQDNMHENLLLNVVGF